MEPYDPFNRRPLGQRIHRASQDSRDGKIDSTSPARGKAKTRGEGSGCREGEVSGPLIHSSYLACLFSHLTLHMKKIRTSLSIIQDSCLQNNHSHFRQLKPLALLIARNRVSNQEPQKKKMRIYVNKGPAESDHPEEEPGPQARH